MCVIGKKFGLLSKRSFLFRAAGDPQGCFLFKHKDCFEALEVNKLDLVVQMAQMTIFPFKKKAGGMIMKAFDILKAPPCLESRLN